MTKAFDKKYIQTLEREIDNYRSQSAELEERVNGMQELREKHDKLKSDYKDLVARIEREDKERELHALKDELTRKSGVPASALRGDTETELRDHHSDLAPLFQPPVETITYIPADTERPMPLDNRGPLEQIGRAHV